MANKRRKRGGVLTAAEKAIVADVVLQQPGGMTEGQMRALGTVMRRTTTAIKTMVEEAREEFLASSKRYVEIHRQATEAGLADGSAKGLEQARQGAEWALEHISAEGVRIIDKATNEPQGVKILVGVQVGGLREPQTVIAVKPLSDDPSHE